MFTSGPSPEGARVEGGGDGEAKASPLLLELSLSSRTSYRLPQEGAWAMFVLKAEVRGRKGPVFVSTSKTHFYTEKPAEAKLFSTKEEAEEYRDRSVALRVGVGPVGPVSVEKSFVD
jgi:hypothetical protein